MEGYWLNSPHVRCGFLYFEKYWASSSGHPFYAYSGDATSLATRAFSQGLTLA